MTNLILELIIWTTCCKYINELFPFFKFHLHPLKPILFSIRFTSCCYYNQFINCNVFLRMVTLFTVMYVTFWLNLLILLFVLYILPNTYENWLHLNHTFVLYFFPIFLLFFSSYIFLFTLPQVVFHIINLWEVFIQNYPEYHYCLVTAQVLK